MKCNWSVSAAHLYIFGWWQIKFSEVETGELRFGEQCVCELVSQIWRRTVYYLLMMLYTATGIEKNKKNYQVKANIYICHKIPRNNLFLSIHDIYFYSENVFIRIQHSVSVLSESWLKQKTLQSLHIFVAKLNISLNQIPGSLNCWGWPSNRTNFGSLCVL